MESFLWKFKNLQYAGVKASLTFEAENCKAFVTLKADLGILPPPPSLHHGYQHEHAQVHRPPAYWRRQVRRKAAKLAAAEQETIPAEQAQHIDDPEVILEPVAEKATNIEGNTNDVAEKASEHFECQLCDFISNWENGLKVHMSRKHSRIEQIDGHYDDPEVILEPVAGGRPYFPFFPKFKCTL